MRTSAWFLNEREKKIAHARTIANQTGQDTRGEIKWPQIIEALKDPKYWTCVVLAITQPITNAGVSNFNPLMLVRSPFRLEVLANTSPAFRNLDFQQPEPLSWPHPRQQ